VQIVDEKRLAFSDLLEELKENFHDAECFPLLYLSLLMTTRSSIF